KGELPPEVARRRIGWIAPALDVVREKELNPAAQRPLHLARACALGERRETPDESRVAPGAGELAVYPTRRIERLRVAHQPLHERLEPFVGAVPGHRDVSDDVAGETGCPVILLEDPVHAAASRA